MSKLFFVELKVTTVLLVEDGQTVEEAVHEHERDIARDIDTLEVLGARQLTSIHDDLGDWDPRCYPYGSFTDKTIKELLSDGSL
jgi:hypothetical protein